MIYDYIIIGQGIAGSVLSYTLSEAGCKILVLDNGYKTSSSIVAAGLYNPISFRRLNKSWNADIILPFALDFYQQVEKIFHKKILYPTDLVRLFSSIEEQNNWYSRNNDPDFDRYLSLEKIPEIEGLPFENPFGYGQVNCTGYLDTKNFLAAVKEHLNEKKAFAEEEVSYDNIHLTEEHIEVNSHKTKQLLFCEGFKGKENPWFNWLPFDPVKGEVLTIRIPGLRLTKTINKGFFLLPLGNELYRVGATYYWKNLDQKPTAEGKEQLNKKLKQLLPDTTFEIVGHEAGVRPAVKTRRPLVGLHPNDSRLGIFNGLGSKGVMLAPYFAHEFKNHLLSKQPLNKEVAIEKFYPKDSSL